MTIWHETVDKSAVSSARIAAKSLQGAKVKRQILLAAIGAIAGCASHPMVRPATGQKVTIEFVNGSPSLYETLMTYQDDFDCFGVNSNQWSHSVSTNVTLDRRPYQTATFQYIGTNGVVATTCGGTITFPATDADHYKVATVFAAHTCGVTVSRPDASSPSGWSNVPYSTRTKTTPFFDTSGPWCAGDKTFRGSSTLTTPRGV